MPRQAGRRLLTPEWLGLALLGALVAAFVVAFSPVGQSLQSYILPERAALRSALGTADDVAMRSAYAARDFKPYWLDGKAAAPAANELLRRLETSGKDGLSPSRYHSAALRRQVSSLSTSTARERMATELRLTRAYVAYVRDLHTPAPAADVAFVDAELRTVFRDPATILSHLARSRTALEAIDEATQMNLLYLQMRKVLASVQTTPERGAPTKALALLNLDRLRALPNHLGDRFVLVDAASARLWLYERGQAVDTMKVVVGTPAHQTPQLAGLIRYAIFNPYWNVPPDMTRDTYAPRIAADRSALETLRMDAWSNFTNNARQLAPDEINWTDVAQGRTTGWLRQRPGSHNAMGAVKFMLPNQMGIYLHDTPQRDLLDKEQRFFSAGCVRVEDAKRLSRWLYNGVDVGPSGPAAEQRVNLPTPVPVYIVYLTMSPSGGASRQLADVYGRDGALGSDLVRVDAITAEPPQKRLQRQALDAKIRPVLAKVQGLQPDAEQP